MEDTPIVPRIVETRGSWSGGRFNNARQQDVTEAIAVLLDSLNSIDEAAMNRIKETFATPMWRALQIKQIGRLHCHRCQYAKDKVERLTTLSLEIPQTSQHIEAFINNQFGDQSLQMQDDRYACPAEQPCPSHANVYDLAAHFDHYFETLDNIFLTRRASYSKECYLGGL